MLADVLLSSIIAVAQNAVPFGTGSADSTRIPAPVSNCFDQSRARADLPDSILTATSFGLHDCAQQNRAAIQGERRAAAGTVTASAELPDAPSFAEGGDHKTDDPHDVSGTGFSPRDGATQRNANRIWSTVDRRFIVLHTLSAMALVADVETTVRVLAEQPKANELNPLFGGRPTRARLYGIGLPLNALSFYLSYHYKRMNPNGRVWKLGPGLCIAFHTAAALNNLVTAR